MRRLLAAALLTVLSAAPPVSQALPRGARIVTTLEADLTGGGAPEVIVGYTLPRDGRPPTVGHSAVLERTTRGGYRRIDLDGAWPGHYPPRFTVQDMTGDGRPELVRQAAMGAAWEMLYVFQRQPDGGYATLLRDPAVSHRIWDADGDGIPEVLASKRIGNIDDRYTQPIRWLDGRYINWHAFKWHYGMAEPPAPRADLVGKSLTEAARGPLDMIVPVDSPAPAGQVLAQRTEDGQQHIAIAAGSTEFAAGPFPGVWNALYVPEELHDMVGVPAGSTPAQGRNWDDWLAPQIAGARQIVHTESLCTPAYIFRLRHLWPVSAGGRPLAVNWLGISPDVPCRGLIFLAERDGRNTPVAPEFTAAIYTKSPARRLRPHQSRWRSICGRRPSWRRSSHWPRSRGQRRCG